MREGISNKGGRELHEIKWSPDKTEVGKEIIWQRVNKYLFKSLSHEIVLKHEK